jgi:hypothetical protein
MLCAHTVRRLKPGTFDAFVATFTPGEGEIPPSGWVRFVALRPRGADDHVITFGFFDGTFEELEASQVDHDYAGRVQAVAPFVEEVLVNGVYDVVVDLDIGAAKTA